MSYLPAPKVIGFNGPPGVGKDFAVLTAQKFINDSNEFLRPVHMKMAAPLKEGVHAAFKIFQSPEFFDMEVNRHLKDEPRNDLLGHTLREMYISFSEDWLKPKFGQDIIGRLIVQRMLRNGTSSVFLFSDAGFVEEWVPVIEQYGPKNCLIIELEAEGKSFSGDSRGYVGEELQKRYHRLTVRRLQNEFGGMDEREFFRMLVRGTVGKFLDLDTSL